MSDDRKEDVFSPSALREAHLRKVLALLEEAVKAAKKLEERTAFLVATTGVDYTVVLSSRGLCAHTMIIKKESEWWEDDIAWTGYAVAERTKMFSQHVKPSVELVQRARITKASLRLILSQIKPPN